IYIIDCKLQPKVQFQVDIFDVGHGLMVMISAHEHALIYDLGPRHFSRYDYINRVLVRNINKHALTVSATLISHLDNDHAGGLSSWYRAGYRDTFSTFHPEGLRKPCDNKQLRFEGLIINSFHADVNGDNRNDHSCLLKISSTNYSVLLTGDISAFAEATLIEKGVDLHATVLLSPHHGSNTSSSVRFIDAVNPEMVIHSSAYQGQWHFPHPEVVKRYQQRHIPQFSTAEQGHIRILFYRDSYRLEFAREQESYWFEQD
ncbi:MAG: DNA internalization-related competence protein ComEC/Rec2, partial [Pseudomonadota bacterium]